MHILSKTDNILSIINQEIKKLCMKKINFFLTLLLNGLQNYGLFEKCFFKCLHLIDFICSLNDLYLDCVIPKFQ